MRVLTEHSHISFEEPETGWEGQIEGKGTQNEKLHLEHILLGVGTVSDEYEIFELRRVDLFIFARN